MREVAGRVDHPFSALHRIIRLDDRERQRRPRVRSSGPGRLAGGPRLCGAGPRWLRGTTPFRNWGLPFDGLGAAPSRPAPLFSMLKPHELSHARGGLTYASQPGKE
jgi:hypothetical protein